MRIRTWHRGMSFRFILRIRRHKAIVGHARRYKWDTRRCGCATRCEEMRCDTRSFEVIFRDKRRCEE